MRYYRFIIRLLQQSWSFNLLERDDLCVWIHPSAGTRIHGLGKSGPDAGSRARALHHFSPA